jgi:hypothetical protein
MNVTNRLNIHDDLTVADLTVLGRFTGGKSLSANHLILNAAEFLATAQDADMIDLMDGLGQSGDRAALALVDKIGARF